MAGSLVGLPEIGHRLLERAAPASSPTNGRPDPRFAEGAFATSVRASDGNRLSANDFRLTPLPHHTIRPPRVGDASSIGYLPLSPRLIYHEVSTGAANRVTCGLLRFSGAVAKWP